MNVSLGSRCFAELKVIGWTIVNLDSGLGSSLGAHRRFVDSTITREPAAPLVSNHEKPSSTRVSPLTRTPMKCLRSERAVCF